MDNENLRVLLEVVDSGSIQGAASRLGLSRSSLRRRIEELEAEVGVPLLHRDAAGVRLTAAGDVVVEQGRPLLEGCRTLLADARAAAGEATGILRVIEPIGMPMSLRVQGLLASRGAFPRLRLVARQVEDPLAHLHEPCELMLHDGPTPERRTWFSRVLVRLPLRVLASPGYLAARGTPRRLADLAEHDVLGWKRPRLRGDAWPLLAGDRVEVSPWIESSDFSLLRALAVQGGGLLLAPEAPFVHEPGEALVSVLDDHAWGDLVFRASTPHLARSDSRTRGTLEQIQTMLAGFPEE